mmetsp:Transcript_5927/g.11310  ORF Transcript_5927/g.11310 Transcript_5927/m.11310 type:complete len:523 (-) Transcript_5927:230-1798(-)
MQLTRGAAFLVHLLGLTLFGVHSLHDLVEETGLRRYATARKLQQQSDTAWSLIQDHIYEISAEAIDEKGLEWILRKITLGPVGDTDPSDVQNEEDIEHVHHETHDDDYHDHHDDGTEEDVEAEHQHEDEHDEHQEGHSAHNEDGQKAIPYVVRVDHLIATYGSNGRLTRLQFQQASLEIIHCLIDERCRFDVQDGVHAQHQHDGHDPAPDSLKFALLTVLLFWAVFGGMLPLLFRHVHVSAYERCLGLMNAFAGGVFLSTAFTHLLPHAIEEAGAFETGRFPMEYFLMMVGFFAVLFFERVLFDKRDHGCRPAQDPNHLDATNFTECPVITAGIYEPEAEQEPKDRTQEEVDAEAGEGESEGVRLWDIRLELISLASVSLHALLAGLTLGMQDERAGVLLLFWTIFSHKSVVAFSLGAKFMRAGVSIQQFLLLTIVFSLVTPVGGLIGIALKNLSTVMEVTLNCISTGAFVYMGTIDVVLDEMTSPSTEDLSQKRVSKFAAMFVGVLSISLLTMTTGDDHGH